jgi:hypothetical protein
MSVIHHETFILISTRTNHAHNSLIDGRFPMARSIASVIPNCTVLSLVIFKEALNNVDCMGVICKENWGGQ